MSIVQKYVDDAKLDTIFNQIESFFPDMDFYNSASFKRAFPDYKCKTGTKKVTGSALVGVWKERKEIAEEKARLLNEKFDRQQKFKAKGAAA